MSDKVTTFLQITLVENDEIISDEFKVTKSFSIFFENAIHYLGIKINYIQLITTGYKIQLKLLLRNMRSIQVSILLKKHYKQRKFSFPTS